MANIRKLKESDGTMFYPLTHERAVQDSNGVKLDSKLEALASKSYVVSWDGASTPSTGSIPAGVSVTYGGATYTGQLAASSSTIGKIYLVKNGDNYDQYITSQVGNTYSWVPLGPTTMTLDGYATDAELAVVSQKVANVTFVNSDTDEEVIEFQTNGGNFIAKVSPEGLEAKEVKARIGGSSVSLTGVFADASDTTSGSLALGDANGKDIVQFSGGHIKTKYFDSAQTNADIEELKNSEGDIYKDDTDTDPGSLTFGDADGKNIVEFMDGHVRTKFFDSREAATGIYKDAGDTNAASLSFGDTNGKNIVIFSEGHIHTKYFDSAQVVNDIEELKQGGGGTVLNDKTQRLMEFKGDYFSYKFGKVQSGNDLNWYERLRILHFSDNHANLTNLAEMTELKDLVHVVVDTGDNSNSGYGADSANTLNDFAGYTNTIGNTAIPLLITQGNHDSYGVNGNSYGITKQQYFQSMSALMASKCPSFVFGDPTHYRSYGYLDITPNATVGTIRIILLDAFDCDDSQFNTYANYGSNQHTPPGTVIPDFGNQFAPMFCVFSQAQIDWFIATLKASAESGYKVITAMHYAFGDNHDYSDEYARTDAYFHQDPFMIPDIIEAFQTKTPLTATYNDDELVNNITVSVQSSDFANMTNGLDYICHLFGHIHSENEYQCRKHYTGNKAYDMLMLGAPSMGADKNTGRILNKVPKQPDTLNSIKLTVLEIDTVSQDIYRVNYGAFKAFDMSNTERSKKIHYRFFNL